MKQQKTPAPAPFETRPYDKKELAMLYFPGSTPYNATRRLKKWIRNIPELQQKLHQWNDRPFNRFYSRKHVELLVHYLGEP